MFKIKKLVLKLLKNMLGMGVGLCLILMLASKLIANYLHIETIMPILILSTIFIPSFLTPVTRGALQGLQRFLGFGISGTGESMLRFVFSVALVSIVSTQLKVNVAILGIALSCVGSFIYTVLLLKTNTF